jgi:integrase
MERELREFLESIAADNTKKGYLRAFGLWTEFSGKTIVETLNTRRKDKQKNLEREIERFYNWCVQVKGLNQNTAYNYVVAMKSIMTFYDIPLKLKRGSCSRIPTMPTDWIPSVAELRLMFSIGDLREKLILSMAKDIPLRINDFLSIKKSDINNATTSHGTDSVPSFMLQTQKTKAPMQCFLSQESIDLLKIYLAGSGRTNPFLFEGKNGKRLNEDSVNLLLKNLVKKAGISTDSVVRFHMFRKVFCSVAASMGMNTDIIKMLTGKRVRSDMSPYYEGVNLHEQWTKVNEHLHLTQSNGNGRITDMQKELEELRMVMKILARYVHGGGSETMHDDMKILDRFLEEEK